MPKAKPSPKGNGPKKGSAASERQEMGQRSEDDGDGARYALSKTDRRALRRITKRGPFGATAKEIGFRRMENAGLATGARLMRLGLVVATRENNFVLKKYAKAKPQIAKPKPAPADITGIEIKKLPPGEAGGLRDLKKEAR